MRIKKLFLHSLRIMSVLLASTLLAGCWSPWPSSKGVDISDAPPETSVASNSSPGQETIIFEEPAVSQPEEIHHPAQTVIHDPKKIPRVAIIIDDMGYHPAIGRGLLNLDLELSFAFLPHAPFSGQLNDLAVQKGRDILVHIPMEAQASKWDPGPGALYLKTPPEKQLKILQEDLAAIPNAIGTNNHMGSKFTANRPAMHRVLAEIKKQGLFFIDSYTTGKTKGLDEAKKMGMKTNRRDIFLDNDQNRKKICRQLGKLISKAQKNGQAIAIGHPYRATLDALRSCGDKLQSVEIVPVHLLVK